jgi:hypothetical protein
MAEVHVRESMGTLVHVSLPLFENGKVMFEILLVFISGLS